MEHVEDDVALVSPAEARRLCGDISQSTQYRLIKEGKYPQPIGYLGKRGKRAARVAFIRREILGWCEQQIKAHRGGLSAA